MERTINKIFPHLPERIKGLGYIAYNLWWSWHPEARMLFKMIDRQAWKESIHNPVKMLKELPEKVLQRISSDKDYLKYYDAIYARFRYYTGAKGEWFRQHVDDAESAAIAYFSAEYGLHHSLPFYAGGLGFLAGDHIKECSDLGVPVVAIGFMYPEGYVRQKIREDGWQEGTDEKIDREAAAIRRLLGENGEQLQVEVPFTDPPIHVAVWEVAVGRVKLYLMDTDIEANDPETREISARLYIGDIEQRLKQEVVLGIGGYRVLKTLGIEHSVIHLNEGHPAFAILESIRDKIENGMSFDEALASSRNRAVFTTHTPVPAGHDVFPFPLIEKYFNSYWPRLGITKEAFFELGINPEAPGAGFNMTALALKTCRYRNAVSKKHQEVTEKMWQGLLKSEAPTDGRIDYVTNGIHVPTWLEPKIMLLFNRYLGPDWIEHHDDPSIWELVDEIPDKELWDIHFGLKNKLINFIRERVRKRWIEDRIDPSIAMAEGVMLDPTVLTIGFARRFATYKRANLILHDRERLKKIVNNRWRPVQIIFAGKAHPADSPGKEVLQQVFLAAKDPEFAGRIAFVEDYGEQLAQYMVHGVDVWLNNPVPPLEASGTSGMKASLNGVPHLSILDGWWIEGFNGENGWAFGEEPVDGDRNEADAHALYDILENKIVPLFYEVSSEGVPEGLVKVMKAAIKSNGPRFSARRMVKEYTQKFYKHALKDFPESQRA